MPKRQLVVATHDVHVLAELHSEEFFFSQVTLCLDDVYIYHI